MPDWKALPPLDLADGRNQELIDHKRWWGSAVRRFNGDHSGQQYSNPTLRRLSTFWWLLCLNAALFRSTGRGLRRFASLATPLLDASYKLVQINTNYYKLVQISKNQYKSVQRGKIGKIGK